DIRDKFQDVTMKDKRTGCVELKYQCLECDAYLSSGSGPTSLRYHLGIHQREKYERRKRSRLERDAGEGVALDEGESSALSASSRTPAQQKREEFIVGALDWITEDFIPFSTFDSPAFRHFLKVVDPDVEM
ncbi:hypothetical protein BGX29_005645, partial [Mortierella sp. GBA35]